MNKQEIINVVADKTGEKRDKVKAIVEATFDSISEALKKGESFQLIGFGTFSVQKKDARKARNPQTGQIVDVPEKKVPKFTPGQALKDSVNN